MQFPSWKEIPWRKIEKKVDKFQWKIFRLSSQGKTVSFHKTQELLVNSHYAKLLAVRRVTQDNKGKKTPGIDGVKALTPQERLKMANTLKIGSSAAKIKRKWIPKPGKDTKRPLGIPTMRDRATQALLLLALEPEWEAKFEPNSYGFRPGRCTHDAIEAIYKSINRKSKYVLDADIEKCFDEISHEALLGKLKTFPKAEMQIRKWLEAGTIDKLNSVSMNERGTPQGGIISPLLSNITLHGVETTLKEFILGKYGKVASRSLTVVRYADDIIVLYPCRETMQELRKQLENTLQQVGLKLSESKTTMRHTLMAMDGTSAGFDYLGFSVKQYTVGKYKRGIGKRSFKTLIMPSKEKVKIHLESIKQTINSFKDPSALIAELNPKIIGWANYYATGVSSRIFGYCDHRITQTLIKSLSRKHPTRGLKWIYKQYFSKIGGYKLTFVGKYKGKVSISLKRYSSVKIVRHIKVAGSKTPYDGDYVYWVRRRGKAIGAPPVLGKLLKKQEGKCSLCGGIFKTQDLIEIDHIVPQKLGGPKRMYNLQLLHRHCHHVKSSTRQKSYPHD